MINLTTGPVTILPQVAATFSALPLSHRSQAFKDIYSSVAATLCERLNVSGTFILTGSGTLANEIMIGQIATRKEHGLVISNGEFGERLVNQATRQQLDFEAFRIGHGESVDLPELANVLGIGRIKWMLFCHCESSTGILNPLDQILELCATHGCDAYVDCISTFAAMPLNLGGVAMASASSGKAIGAFAGLALLFCNKEVSSCNNLPLYLDLLYVKASDGIPFTLSSNLLAALGEAVVHNLCETKWKQLSVFSEKIFEVLKPAGIIPFAKPGSRVFTIIPREVNAGSIASKLYDKGIQLSWQSNYLVKNNWLQLAVFGSYSAEDMNHALECLKEVFELPS